MIPQAEPLLYCINRSTTDVFPFYSFKNPHNNIFQNKITFVCFTKKTSKEFELEVKNQIIREQIIKNSPQDNEDYFVVPKVIE